MRGFVDGLNNSPLVISEILTRIGGKTKTDKKCKSSNALFTLLPTLISGRIKSCLRNLSF